jgi:cytoskeletal protein CcmA (bactofilin family)
MWKMNAVQAPSNSPTRGPALRQPVQPISLAAVPADNQSSIGKGCTIIGEITGSEPLFIDGIVHGSISFPSHLVTIGRNGQVTATVSARDVVVLGEVFGDIIAFNRLEIRSAGAVTGDVTASRFSIEDGAFFKGGVDIVHSGAKPAEKTDTTANRAATLTKRKDVQADAGDLRRPPVRLSA